MTLVITPSGSAVVTSPLAVTHSAWTRLSLVVPCNGVSQPWALPSTAPTTEACESRGPGVARPCALSERLGDAIGATHVGMIRARAALLAGRFDETADRLRTVLDDAEAGADTGLLRVDLAYALLRRGDLTEAAAEFAAAASVSDEQDLTWLAVQPVTALLAAEEGDLARAGGIAAAARAEFAARGFGWPFTVDRLEAVERA